MKPEPLAFSNSSFNNDPTIATDSVAKSPAENYLVITRTTQQHKSAL
jgi:hypothetical protein